MEQIPAGLSAHWTIWHQTAASVSASLEPGEAWIGGWDGIGLYEGNNKVERYQTASMHITTHRLLVVPAPAPPPAAPASPPPPPLQAPLSAVRQTEFYTGFMRSSPKISLFLGPAAPASPADTDGAASAPGEARPAPAPAGAGGAWPCAVCGFVNAAAAVACGLCGVARAISASLPPTRAATPAPARPASAAPAAPAGPSMSLPGTPPPKTPAEPAEPAQIACPACTFLNHASLRSCEMCSSALPRPPGAVRAERPRPASMTAPPGGPAGAKTDVVRLSFRRGGEKEAYRRLKNVLGQKAWEAARREQTGAGIDGIMRSMTLGARAQDEHMKTAFDDLEVLMVRAGEMARLAQSLSAKLQAAGPAAAAPAEASLVHSTLVQLGLPAPALTPDMARSQRDYEDGLAAELGALLTGPPAAAGGGAGKERPGQAGLMVGPTGRGVIGIDEVWGLWMRARGVALLAPATLLAVVPLLASHTAPPIRPLALPSGLQVLHAPRCAPGAVSARVRALVEPAPPGAAGADEGARGERAERSVGVVDVAAHEGMPIGLASDLLEMIDALGPGDTADTADAAGAPVAGAGSAGGLARDDQAVGGPRWYRDLITEWPVAAMSLS